jgi:hypothetical protein
MQRTARALALGIATLLASISPAWATGNFLCEADDASLKFSAESTFSHGLGEVFMGFKGTVAVLLEDAPKDWASFEIDAAHLTHHWFAGDELNLHIYREREGAAPHGYVELVVTTRQREDDETAYDGAYKLTVYDVGSASDAEGKTLRAEGKISCSVG